MEKKNKSSLKVNAGIEKPNSINRAFLNKARGLKKRKIDSNYYINGVLNGERKILAQAITLVESTKIEHRKQAEVILEACLQQAKDSIRIGITGVPGVGKSTFIEAFGKHLTSLGHKVAVLAIDPSSNKNKGSILGDKTRMEDLSTDINAFIRPSPSSGSLGGVAQKTRESISLCEAAGFNIILVETVGVGQSEIAVHSMVDFFLLLMLAGAGDELQGMKRGIMEMSDAIFINKADGDNIHKAELSKVQFANALHLFPPPESQWTPIADICSSITGLGIDKLWSYVQDYVAITKENGYFFKNRKEQEIFRFHEQIERKLKQYFYQNINVAKHIKLKEEEVLINKKSAYKAAEEIIEKWKNA